MKCLRPTILLPLLPAAVLLLGIASSQAQDEKRSDSQLDASPRHHEWVEIDAPGDRKVRSYVVFPEVDRPVPAVIVIHENRGLTDWVRTVADKLGEAGFVAIAPDLLSGTGPDGGATDSFPSSDAARQGIYKLPAEQVLTDLDAAVAYAKNMEATTDKVSVAGFCWGGGQSFRFATHNDQIQFACVYYGSAPDEELLKQVKVPVYGFYGGNDFRITGQVPKVEQTLKDAGKKFDPVVYEGAGHAFMRTGEGADAQEANRKATEEAWKRWLALLKS